MYESEELGLRRRRRRHLPLLLLMYSSLVSRSHPHLYVTQEKHVPSEIVSSIVGEHTRYFQPPTPPIPPPPQPQRRPFVCNREGTRL